MPPAPVTTSIPGQRDLVEEVIASFPERGRILDVGTGAGLAARLLAAAGWEVCATGFDMEAYFEDAPLPPEVRTFSDVDICDAHQFDDASFDAIWCAHVLEHVSNPGLALDEIRRLLKPDGWLFVAVPPYKDQVVGGHVNSGWNIGSLMYVLADAGFGLAEGRFIRHGYNLFGMVRRGPGRLPEGALRRANGDIEALAEAGRFPRGFQPEQGFDGRLPSVNWLWRKPPEEFPAQRRRLADPPPIAPMRIAFFVPWISTGRGGTENVGRMMANAMARRGHEVIVFTFDDARAPSRWPLEEGVELMHLPEADDAAADDQMAVELAARSPDVIVGLHMNRTMLRYVRCAHRAGVPLVLSEHIDPRFPQWIGTFSPEEREVAMAGAAVIHMLTEAFVATLHPSERDKARVIPNTVPEPEAKADPGGVKSRRTLLAVARLVPRKNVTRLIEAFARLAEDFPDWRLQIVGDGQLRDALAKRAKAAGLEARVDFAGEQEEVYPFYAAADLFVIPSLFEGFPLTLCEAIAHGLPAIGFASCGGVRAQIRPEETGLLCPGISEAEELEAALRRLMSDDAARARMGAAARELFVERFGNAAVHAQWEELFADAALTRRPLARPGRAALMSVRLWEEVWGPISHSDLL